MSRSKVLISKEELQKLYWTDHKSPVIIAKLYHCDPVTVRTRMKELEIPKRTRSDALMRYRKHDFSGDLAEKAYMLGFRLGDLNVYQTSERSDLIVVRCNTSQLVQVKLIESLFAPYGKVTVSYGRHGINVNCFLNRSFDFLLPKYVPVPDWVEGNDVAGIAFIAGYNDAEGSLLLNQSKARFKIDSYDNIILSWIASWLLKRSIQTKIRCLVTADKRTFYGMKINCDLWRLNINEAFSLLKFIRLIKPFTRHENRLQQLMICEKNIEERISNKSIRYVSR